jgi:hypothetical protein
MTQHTSTLGALEHRCYARTSMVQPGSSRDPAAYLPTVPASAGYAPIVPVPQAPPGEGAGVLARLPLQIGTTSTWSAGRAAAALFPGFALLGVAVMAATHIGSFTLVAAIGAVGGMLILYAIGHIRGAIRTRASDVLLLPDGLLVDGGQLHAEKMPWSEFTAPYAEIEETTVRRITLGSMLMVALMILTQTSGGSATSGVRVWRLHVHRKGEKRTIAETDRPIERDSMQAAASSVCAVVSGQRYVAEAPAVPAKILSCQSCGAPAVPDDAAFVKCAYCNVQVALPDDIRGQAAAVKNASQNRAATAGIIAKLREQPRAAHANQWLTVIAVLMFGAWPIGWGLVAFRVLADGFQATDLFCLLLPFAAVVAGFFLARARLADRGALQLLTLGFGALSPRKEGEPSRCRRCQGPLPVAGLGGVTQCRYCSAENIVGLDLRPSVDQARTEQATFDVALAQRAAEKRLWTTLTIVAGFALLAWMAGTVAYIAHIEEADHASGHESAKSHPSPPPPPASPPPPQGRETPPKGSPPPPRPGGTKKPK